MKIEKISSNDIVIRMKQGDVVELKSEAGASYKLGSGLNGELNLITTRKQKRKILVAAAKELAYWEAIKELIRKLNPKQKLLAKAQRKSAETAKKN